MREYRFSLTRILPYKDRVYDSVLIRENMGQWKPVFSHVLCSVSYVIWSISRIGANRSNIRCNLFQWHLFFTDQALFWFIFPLICWMQSLNCHITPTSGIFLSKFQETLAFCLETFNFKYVFISFSCFYIRRRFGGH